ncbi:MAG: tetratricopeptide repeat protein [Bryobacterales bacterium]|nr:tetratricopeptide repeat protein [Bryobacterales bacterium]
MIAVAVLLLAWQQVTPELRGHVEAGLKAKAAGDLETAVREFRRVVELAPALPAAYVNLGAVLFQEKDYAGAIPPLRKALELTPDLPGASEMLGASLLAQGYAADAIPHLEKAQADDLLGVALLEAGRERDAVERLEAALQKRPGDPDLLYYLAQAHGRLARMAVEGLRASHPDSARTAQLSGEAAAAAGNREVAEKQFRTALEKRPDLRGVHYSIGELYLASGDYEKAEPEFREEVRMAPGSAAAAYKLGLVLLNRGNAKDAALELQRADTLSPGMPETLLELGKAQFATGDSSGAEKAFLQVLRAEKETRLAEAAHFHLSQLYRAQGRTAEAERETKAFQDLKRRVR